MTAPTLSKIFMIPLFVLELQHGGWSNCQAYPFGEFLPRSTDAAEHRSDRDPPVQDAITTFCICTSCSDSKETRFLESPGLATVNGTSLRSMIMTRSYCASSSGYSEI